MHRKVRRKSSASGAVSFNMTPMIDCVFQLIIFFVLTSQFIQLQIEQVTLPLSFAAKPKDVSEYLNVVINLVDEDDPKCMVLGQQVDYRVIEGDNELSRLLKDRKQDAGEGKPLNVILRADALIPYEAVASVMLAAGRAEIEGWWITTEIKDMDEVLKD
ncbi:MAG: biopolymer transporter ExbD [Planctomycetes bacterium]|nr:biopolymer transporter ExbD [Planctomycetota bacterium]